MLEVTYMNSYQKTSKVLGIIGGIISTVVCVIYYSIIVNMMQTEAVDIITLIVFLFAIIGGLMAFIGSLLSGTNKYIAIVGSFACAGTLTAAMIAVLIRYQYNRGIIGSMPLFVIPIVFSIVSALLLFISVKPKEVNKTEEIDEEEIE